MNQHLVYLCDKCDKLVYSFAAFFLVGFGFGIVIV